MQSVETRNNRIGILTSLGIHVALFVVLFFMMAWRAPDPPLPEYGIELNFGLDDQGSGDVQPDKPVGDDTEQQSVAAEEQASQTQADESNSTEKEVVPEKTVDPSVSKLESPITVKEEKKIVKTETNKDKKDESKPNEKAVAEFKKDNKKETTTTQNSKQGTAGNQGDDTNKVGDKGSEQGTLDSKALYGTPGGGGGGDGFGLSMSGWAWADAPKVPDLPDNENGKVIFEIECDETGEIVGISTVERSLSPRSEQILKDEIRKNSLIRTSGGRAPERSKGRIVFILKTK